MNRQEEIINTIKVLRKEVDILTRRTKARGTGHLHTTIGVINKRIEELIEEVTAPYFEDEDVYDGYEHTKEYYNTERNKAPQVQTMTSDGLSNRSMKTMKEIYGQAVQTTSEMMQDELEPLPINTFK